MSETWLIMGSTIWAVLIAIAAVWLILAITQRRDRPANFHAFVQNIVLTLTAAGALILIPFSLWNDYIGWTTYQATMKPSILFRAATEREHGGAADPHLTHVSYRNVSNNDCTDFRIRAVADDGATQADISDTFRQGVLFPSQDERAKVFLTYPTIAAKGLDLTKAEQAGSEVHLTLGYSCLHFGKKMEVPDHQIYRWDAGNREWVVF